MGSKWSLYGVQVESIWSSNGVYVESKWSTWSPSGVYKEFMRSKWSLCRVFMDYVESKWSPSGLVGECKIQHRTERERRRVWGWKGLIGTTLINPKLVQSKAFRCGATILEP